MRWEKLQIHTGVVDGGGFSPYPTYGPGKRWGHTCNAIRGGKLLYVFGGYGSDNRHTNQVHVFDTASRTWSTPMIKGTPPIPRDSHSCTTVGDSLFIFGGTDGSKPLSDLHVLDTSSNTWLSPSVKGEAPEPREGHSAALIGKRLFIFAGCAKSSNIFDQKYFDDLFILDTETFVWMRAETSGCPPSKRESHTCSSWKNKVIVIGGEDSNDYYLSDVHVLDTDTLVWRKLETSGELFTPRAGHTAVGMGKNLFVFGGFADESTLYDDSYIFDVDSCVWTKVMATGEGPSPRFSVSGDSLDPHKCGVIVFLGGCNGDLDALDDMYYLHTGFTMERDERRLEKLSLRKQLKLKCQEQSLQPPGYKVPGRVETNSDFSQPIPVSVQEPINSKICSKEYLHFPGKKAFQAKVTKCMPVGYSIKAVIDGKVMHGVVFANTICSNNADETSERRNGAVELDAVKLNGSQNSNSDTANPTRQIFDVPEVNMEVAAPPNTNGPALADASQSHGTFDVPEVKIEAAAPPNTNGPALADAFQSHEELLQNLNVPESANVAVENDVSTNLRDANSGEQSSVANNCATLPGDPGKMLPGDPEIRTIATEESTNSLVHNGPQQPV